MVTFFPGLFHLHTAATVLRCPLIVAHPETDILPEKRLYISRQIEGLWVQHDEPFFLQWTASNSFSSSFNHLVPLVQ